MLPPADVAVFQNNPKFEALYKTLTTSILNPDGSTKNDPGAKKRDAVKEELKAHRLKATRQHLLRQAISTAIPTPNPDPEPPQPQRQPSNRRARPRPQSQPESQQPPLPPDLMNLLLLLPPFLDRASTMPPADLLLLLSNPPFSNLEALFPQLVAAVSARLISQATALARVLSPNTNSSYIHRQIPSLPSIATSLQSHLQSQKQALSSARLRATHTLTSHLSAQTDLLARLLRLLDTKHGPAARSAVLRAQHGALSARTLALASEALLWDARATVYPLEARRALGHYQRHLRDATMRLGDGIRVREAELRDYGVRADPSEGDRDKERTMREMGRVWREMEGRLREVRGDLDRLR
ncbi:hypothetical protein F5Y15DRAFT_426248 [Xylariaceae sp. FL0016]|nr:hypothetical protein F5Y15DRAFT_426248 [Xylariaceae sp. FL0016]